MFGTLFKILFDIIKGIVSFILLPINTLIINNFPDVAIQINRFNVFVSTYIGGSLGFFGNLIPPMTKNLILFYLSYLLIRFVLVLQVHLLVKIFTIIKNVKIW